MENLKCVILKQKCKKDLMRRCVAHEGGWNYNVR